MMLMEGVCDPPVIAEGLSSDGCNVFNPHYVKSIHT